MHSAPETPGKARTFYDILEISRLAKAEDIKKAYRKLAKQHHPDRNPDNPDAQKKFVEVQEAYATLSNQWKKALYDQDLQFGKDMPQNAEDREKWTEHWANETEEERAMRRERYKRYANEERNDLPTEPLILKMAPVALLGIVGFVYYITIKAPEWFGGESEKTYCDPAFDDRSVPLVRAYHNPVLGRWERLLDGLAPPTPKELYAYCEKKFPEQFTNVDPRSLPLISLTVLSVPRTQVSRPCMTLKPAVA